MELLLIVLAALALEFLAQLILRRVLGVPTSLHRKGRGSVAPGAVLLRLLIFAILVAAFLFSYRYLVQQ